MTYRDATLLRELRHHRLSATAESQFCAPQYYPSWALCHRCRRRKISSPAINPLCRRYWLTGRFLPLRCTWRRGSCCRISPRRPCSWGWSTATSSGSRRLRSRQKRARKRRRRPNLRFPRRIESARTRSSPVQVLRRRWWWWW